MSDTSLKRKREETEEELIKLLEECKITSKDKEVNLLSSKMSRLNSYNIENTNDGYEFYITEEEYEKWYNDNITLDNEENYAEE